MGSYHPKIYRLASYKEEGPGLRPGGYYARKLAKNNIVQIVGDTVFVHGGVTPQWAKYGVDKVNKEERESMLGYRKKVPRAVRDTNGPFWSRLFSQEVCP